MDRELRYVTIKELPPESRPRERLLFEGSDAVSPAELLALIIGSGSTNQSAVSLGEQILGRFDSLSEFASVSINDLCCISGIGAAKAAKILAAIELGRRLALSSCRERLNISNPDAAAGIFMASMRHLKVEHLRVAVLDTKNRLLSMADAAIGGLNISVVQPRDIFRLVLTANGASCILAHNHPSGDPQPSAQDIEMTAIMAKAASLLGVDLHDHIVIGDGSFISLKQEGYI